MAELHGPVTLGVVGRRSSLIRLLSSAVSRFWLCGGAYIIELLSTFFYSLLPTRPSQISRKYSSSAFTPPAPHPPSAAGVHASLSWLELSKDRLETPNNLVIHSGHFLFYFQDKQGCNKQEFSIVTLQKLLKRAAKLHCGFPSLSSWFPVYELSLSLVALAPSCNSGYI